MKASIVNTLANRRATALMLAAVITTSSAAQQASGPVTPLPPYRPPALALVQPAAGGSVPQDRPVVVFRFAPGERSDPIDARSFAVTVDGEDRTALFQVAPSEAWGPLTPAPNGERLVIAPGAHQAVGRVCSVRGACGEVSALVTVAASAAASGEKGTADRRRDVIQLVLDAARKLLKP